MDETLERLGETIASALAGSIAGHWVQHGELTLTASARDIIRVMTFLRDDERCQFYSFIDITAVDWPARERRFDVVYHLLSPKLNARIRVKIEAGEETRVPSIIEVFPETKTARIFAWGIRNANGMALVPGTNRLWTVVNERDMLGSDLVPDYLARPVFGGRSRSALGVSYRLDRAARRLPARPDGAAPAPDRAQ